MLNLKPALKLSVVLCLPFALLSACSKSSDNFSGSCEVSGESFGIVGGKTLGSGNMLSATTVFIVHKKYNDETSICTGTLIAPDKVLTAAHCTSSWGGVSKIAFSNNVDCVANNVSLKTRDVSATAVHPDYSYYRSGTEQTAADLAIMKFSGELPEGYTVRDLPSRSYQINPANDLVMAGYGTTDYYAEDSGTLRFTTAQGSRLSDSYLRANAKTSTQVKDGFVLEQRYNGVCSGDSGGPLYTYDNGRLVLIGITSSGVDIYATESTKKPAICNGVSLFSDVRKQLDWIEKQMNSL